MSIDDHSPITLDSRQWQAVCASLAGVDPTLPRILAGLNLRAYPDHAPSGDRTAYVVLDIHGVSIGAQRRHAGLYLHADTTETSDRYIAFEINGSGQTSHPTDVPAHTSPGKAHPMKIGDTVRLRFPLRDFEHRPATICAVDPQPEGLHGDRIQLAFPTGQHRWHLAGETTPHDRDSGRHTVTAAITLAHQILASIEPLTGDLDDENLADQVTAALACLRQITGDRTDTEPVRRRRAPLAGHPQP